MPDSSAAATARLRRLGLTLCAIVLAGVTLATYATFSLLPYNPVRLPFAEEVSAAVWFPEGWAFFTRDARDEDIYMFTREADGTWRNASALPHFQASHLFGLDRTSKAQGIEVGALVQKAASAQRQACREAPTACLNGAAVSLTVENTAPRPTLCGEVGLAFQKPIPWAWSRSPRPIVMPSRVLKLEVKC